eukprot:CAMPEP_0176445714 /NCGR_PEP_ID=MMETSP0127-20121128/23880_1 /TAXON_ID=938130 /ORGANISM="Platyophrya macrostoma, Strain WH" /LENGTH=279 /DNA_ID=CAMNT_0017831581 /DNA_START=177 /DNA_END=1016 /DNA_ORIENTATION=-
MPMQRTSVEVVDADFKFVAEVPVSQIAHRPSARLNVSRLLFCRNYRPFEAGSCSMGDGCKFVHADVDLETLESRPIHVKYAWRSEELCMYRRLPAGRVLSVTAPNNRPPVDEIPSEQILVTQGALNEDPAAGPLSHCAHYYFNRMCNRGERCNFIHAVHVDPTIVSDFERISARHVGTCALLPAKRRGHGRSAKTFPQPPALTAGSGCRLRAEADVDEESDDALIAIADAEHVCGLSQLSSGESDDARQQCEDVIPPRRSATMRFRHDPYSFNFVRVVV